MDDPLVTSDWLQANLQAPDIRVVEATWYPPGSTIDMPPKEAFDAGHIPGATFLDIESLADPDSPYPNTLPSTVLFSSRMRHLGLGDGHRIIVYDRNNFVASARVWWMLRTMGFADVKVLDGGYDSWCKNGGAIDDMPPFAAERHFTPRLRSDLVKTVTQMERLAESGGADIIDARAPGRFTGDTPEPRPNMPAGHIPGSRNVPAGTLLTADGTLKSADGLAELFGALERPIVTTCGSGITASILALGLARLGHDDVAVYDGSWTEWADSAERPIETGPARDG